VSNLKNNAAAVTGKNELMFVAILTVAAFLLRLIGYDSESLWSDEIITLRAIAAPCNEMIRERLGSGQLPLYFLLIKAIRALAGENRLLLLLPNMLASTLAVTLTWAAARQLPGLNARGRLLATALVASSPMIVCHAQELRMYPLALLGCSAVLYFYLKSLTSLRAALGLAISSLLFGLTHPAAPLFLMALFLTWPFVLRRLGWRALPQLAAFAFAGFPLLALGLHASGLPGLQMMAAGQYPFPVHGLIHWLIFSGPSYSAGSTLVLTPGITPASYFFPETVFGLLLLFILVARGFFKRTRWPDRLPDIGIILLLILSLFLAKSLPIWTQPKYLMYSYIPFYIIAGRGFSSIERRTVTIMIGTALIVANLFVLTRRLETTDLPQWRETAQLIEQESTTEELVFHGGAVFINVPFAYYYQRNNYANWRTHEKILRNAVHDQKTRTALEDIKREIATKTGAWFIDGHEGTAESEAPVNNPFGSFVKSFHQRVENTDNDLQQYMSSLFSEQVTTTLQMITITHYFTPASQPVER
jgi:mannosyltransferase